MSKIIEAALMYESRGWSIIPVKRGEDKIPLVKWKRYQEERATPEQIIQWFTRWPKANIGLVTGKVSGLIVVESDPRHGGDAQEILDEAPTELISMSGRGDGGCHLFYKYPRKQVNVSNRVGFREGIDVRGDGGFVVLPPSKHHSGGRYTWETAGSPGRMPRDMVQAIEAWSPGTGAKGGADDRPFWITELLEQGVKEGRRDDSCARLAGYFASTNTPRDTTFAIMMMWDQNKNRPPLGEADIRKTVDSVYKTKRRRDAQFGKVTITEEMRDEAVTLFDVVSFADYMAEHRDEKIRWTVKDWLPTSTIAFMVAAPESYKTWMLLDLAVSVASGTNFLNMYKVSEPGPVLIIQQEDYHGQMTERLDVIINERFERVMEFDGKRFKVKMPPNIPIHLHTERKLRFDDAAVMDMLEYQIATLKPKVVLIDPLYSAASSDDYMAKAAEQMGRLKTWRDRYGCSFVIAHHTKKKSLPRGKKQQGDPSTEREEGWGSQFLNAFLETGWQIRNTPEDGTVLVRRHFKSTKSKPTIHIKFDIETNLRKGMRYKVSEFSELQQIEDDEIIKTLDKPIRLGDIVEATGIKRTKLQRRLKALIESGSVIKVNDNQYMVYNVNT